MNKNAVVSDDAPDETFAPVAPSSATEVRSAKPKAKHQPGSLKTLIGAGKRNFGDTESIDAFIRAERATWSS